MRYFILPVIAVALISCASTTTTHRTTSSNAAKGPANTSTTRSASYREKSISTVNLSADIINGVNDYRKTKGLPPMRLLAIAASEATQHSSDMASRKVSFGHAGFEQRALAIANELKGTSSTGENVAFGKMTGKQVIDAWLKSPDHKANIEGAFNYTGVGVAKDSRGIVYYTQIFVKK